MPVGDRQKLITSLVSTVLCVRAQTDKKFEWFINKHLPTNFGEHFSIIDKIFKALNGNQTANYSKRTTSLKCDAYFGGQYNFIFEFDEYQHFSSARLQTINLYPDNLRTNFSLADWTKMCEQNKLSADKYRFNKTTSDFKFSGGRTRQRAYLDSFRDLLPKHNGLNPTLRISDLEVKDIHSDNKDSRKKIEHLLRQRIK